MKYVTSDWIYQNIQLEKIPGVVKTPPDEPVDGKGSGKKGVFQIPGERKTRIKGSRYEQ